ncbi:MAG: hypothetical protein HFG57_10480 [Lachnospiraceae bacterium]|nr:hypothetical protein [Lachnospiraceae bacterium]
MKRILHVLIATVMILAMSMNVWAQAEMYDGAEVEEATIVNMKVSDNEVEVTGVTRGRYLSSVELDLTDEGFGVAGIEAVVLCHEAMQKIRLRLTLEKYNGSSWVSINEKEFLWTDDQVDGDLSMAIVSYRVGALLKGDYRLRANVAVRALTLQSEAMTTRTGALTFK